MSARGRRRAIGVVGLVALIVATLGAGIAAAIAGTVQISRSDRKFEVARTFEALVPAGSGVPGGATPSDDGSNWPTVEWQVGDVRFTTSFISMETDPGFYSFGLMGPRVTNTGRGPVTIVSKGDAIEYTPSEGAAYVPNLTKWLAPDDWWGGDVGWFGEVFNTGDSPTPPTIGETSRGQVVPISILDEDGATGSGFYSWSFYFDEAQQMGHFVFTLQMRGNT